MNKIKHSTATRLLAEHNKQLKERVAELEAQLAASPVAQPQDDLRDQFDALDLDNHRLRRAMQKLMGRLATLLDEDRFAECEDIVKHVGVQPPVAQDEPCACWPGKMCSHVEKCARAATPAQDKQDTELLDWLETELSAIDTWYRGSPSYEHDAGWFKDRALRLIEKARTAFQPTPLPAGSQDKQDAVDAARLEMSLEAVEIAKAVMDYCGGDAWERQATYDNRTRFNELYAKISPPEPEKPFEGRLYQCDACGKWCADQFGLKQHKRAKHAAMQAQKGGAA